MKTFRVAALLLAVAVSAAFPAAARAQGASRAGSTSSSQSSPPTPAVKHVNPGTTAYVKPSDKQNFRNYVFDSFGPYAILTAVAGGGIQQAKNNPPEWGGGMQAYRQRVGSTLGINLVATTTRYALAEAFREDTIYYRCECSGFFPRLEHALISTVTTRRGDDGHTAFSFPKLAAPYAGTRLPFWVGIRTATSPWMASVSATTCCWITRGSTWPRNLYGEARTH